MMADGRWKPGRKRARHRKARPRRAAFGELIQWDSSEHSWFEKRGPKCTLIQVHDDATNRLLMSRFVPKDDGVSNRQVAIDRTESIIRRALAQLNVALILTQSRQAKGRIERDFGTSQDRLVKELRVAGVSDLDEGNRFLEEVYIPYWNERFAVEPTLAQDAHRPCPGRPTFTSSSPRPGPAASPTTSPSASSTAGSRSQRTRPAASAPVTS